MDRATEALAALDWARLEALAEDLQELAATGALTFPSPALHSRRRVFHAVTQATKVNRNVHARVSGVALGHDKEQIWER